MGKYLSLFALFSVLTIGFSNPNRNVDRISKKMCETYKSLVAVKNYSGWCLPYQDPIECYKESISYKCKYQFTGLIVGGENTSPGEFPHMAAIGWDSNGEYKFSCGGSLISNKFVLTVAHCRLLDGKLPKIVRLGDQNLKTTTDMANPVDYNILQFINHPNYNGYSKQNDIALIELVETVTFGEFIRPACLNQGKIVEKRVVATGWGQNGTFSDPTDELQKVGLEIFTNQACQAEYDEEDDDRTIFASQVCAGNKSGGKDTCRGDSGAPIQTSTDGIACVFDIIGLTSFGQFMCGSNIPAVYTRVSSYLDWIEGKVWPQ